ncbi:uncharacterized protein LAESUDRAFT_704515 [Laetiporus sulphureus 93-53]|uniref:Cyclic-AMP phosphodiesterase n=1 Tax=Laetiporus sulphureus 93-53 TaxID=1314785 RepID=A0A165CVT1_9APHY|nr:uncharacterized protein LAESUDRAFT_704515 [Laetiporus sulphureus 93-53]KZT03526.1 hypothetical protein LAESUDRAFT_704515 [Laetiporus sulphureus 93-53]
MPTFDLVAVGCGGGPDERNLSCYFLKPSGVPWSDGIIALEAGSGIGALDMLLHKQPDLFGTKAHEGGNTAAEVYSWIRCFLISHAHLDHTNGLVLAATTIDERQRPVFGTSQCMEDLQLLFNNRIWPKLASPSEESGLPLLLRTLPTDGQYHTVSPHISVLAMPLTHGCTSSTLGASYPSTAFFLRHDRFARELLFLGDVEPDRISSHPQNRAVWRTAAGKVPGVLNALFVECSYPAGRPADRLYGHMSPEHLAEEMRVLAGEVVAFRRGSASQQLSSGMLNDLRGALEGIKLYIIHCKDDAQGAYTEPMPQVIARQVRALVDAQELGLEVIAVEQGMHISI